MTWAAMMNAMYHKFEPVDQKTGEQFVGEYPTEEAWRREIEGFFEDRFALQANYAFTVFLKLYGQFGKPPKRNVMKLVSNLQSSMTSGAATNKNEQYRCPKCQEIHSPKLICS